MKSEILGMLTAGLLAVPMASHAALVATGYDYTVTSGPPFASVLLPTGIGDNLFDLYSWDGTQFVDTGTDLQGGVAYAFSPAVSSFGIRGIETSANLDPNNPNAFVTGLTFAGVGNVSMTMTPVTTNVPEPSTLALLGLALAGVAANRRYKQ